MTLKFYSISCGDAACIEFSDKSGAGRCVLIDAGYERTFREVLFSEIMRIQSEVGQIDLWVISHIHDDHIGGAISYFKAVTRKEIPDIVSNWGFNPISKVRSTIDTPDSGMSQPTSYNQGIVLEAYLSSNGKLPVMDITFGSMLYNSFDLEIQILSPRIEVLSSLRKKYAESDKKITDYRVSEVAGSILNDYSKTIDSFDIGNSVEDTSLENESSITFITTLNDRKVLWLADAPSNTIVRSLKELGYSETNPLKVDLVKVSHHGSNANNSLELYGMIRCRKYVFCSDGENKYQLPTKECIATILRSNQRMPDEQYEIIFTCRSQSLQNLFASDGEEVYERWNFKTTFPTVNLWVEVSL